MLGGLSIRSPSVVAGSWPFRSQAARTLASLFECGPGESCTHDERPIPGAKVTRPVVRAAGFGMSDLRRDERSEERTEGRRGDSTARSLADGFVQKHGVRDRDDTRLLVDERLRGGDRPQHAAMAADLDQIAGSKDLPRIEAGEPVARDVARAESDPAAR